VWLVARLQPDLFDSDGVRRIWIQANLAVNGAGAQIAAAIGDTVLNVCLYNAGICESAAIRSERSIGKKITVVSIFA
jgi:hypothetical protein